MKTLHGDYGTVASSIREREDQISHEAGQGLIKKLQVNHECVAQTLDKDPKTKGFSSRKNKQQSGLCLVKRRSPLVFDQ